MKTKVDKNNVVGQRKVASGWSATLFSWAFFVLMWNLMSRSDSVDGLMLQHLEWQEDSLIIEEYGHNGNQTGADSYGEVWWLKFNWNDGQITHFVPLGW